MIVVGDEARGRGDGERHRQPVIAGRIDRAPCSGRASQVEPVGVLVDLGAHRARSPAASAEIRSLSLTRSSAAPRTVSSRPVGHHRRQRREGRNLVDDAGHFVRLDVKLRGRAERERAGGPSARRAAASRPSAVTDGAGAAKDVEHAVREGLRPTPSMSIAAPGVPAASAAQKAALEMSPGT